MTPQYILWGIPGFIAYYFLQAVKPARAKGGWDFVVEVGFLSLVCFAVSHVLVGYVTWCLPGLAIAFHHVWPPEYSFVLLVGIFPVSEIVGASLARLSRHWWGLMSIYHAWINKKQRDFRFTDIFFVRTTELLSEVVFITLKGGKVYVGLLTAATHDPNEPNRFISVVPVLSGYRKKENQLVVYTTFYEPNEGQNFLVPVSELSSLAKFDWKLLRKFYESGNVTFEIPETPKPESGPEQELPPEQEPPPTS